MYDDWQTLLNAGSQGEQRRRLLLPDFDFLSYSSSSLKTFMLILILFYWQR